MSNTLTRGFAVVPSAVFNVFRGPRVCQIHNVPLLAGGAIAECGMEAEAEEELFRKKAGQEWTHAIYRCFL